MLTRRQLGLSAFAAAISHAAQSRDGQKPVTMIDQNPIRRRGTGLRAFDRSLACLISYCRPGWCRLVPNPAMFLKSIVEHGEAKPSCLPIMLLKCLVPAHPRFGFCDSYHDIEYSGRNSR
jgi:hypothetical protein